MKIYLFLLSALTFLTLALFIAPTTAKAYCACTGNCNRTCETTTTWWCNGANGDIYGGMSAYNGDCPADATHRSCTIGCTYGSATGIELGSIKKGVTTWSGSCSAVCGTCSTPTYTDYSYSANTCSSNNGTASCYTTGSNCNSTSCAPRYNTTNNCDSCHIANGSIGPGCGCVQQTPPTVPILNNPGLNLSTPVKSGTTVTPSSSCSNCTGVNYSPGSTLLCNTSDSNTTQVFTAYAYKDWGCQYNPSHQQSNTVSQTVTIQPWSPAISGNPSVAPNSLYDDEALNITATGVNPGSDTTSINFNFAGNTGTVPATNWNGDRAEGTTHTVTFTPIHHDSCTVDKSGPAKTATHITLRRPDPAIRGVTISKALTRKGETITVTGEIKNSHLWDFNILMDWQGNSSAMESFHLGHSAGRYTSASSFFSTSTAAEESWNRFSITFTPVHETTSLSANIKIDYHRILKPTNYRASQFNTGVNYEVAALPVVSSVTTALESNILTTTITGDKFRILSKASDNNYRGDVFFNSTTQAVTAIPRSNISSWTMNQIKVTYPPMTGDVKVCLDAPIADGCSNTDKQYSFETDKDTVSINNSWWTFKTLPPPECKITIIPPPLTNLYVLSKQDTSDPFLVQATWKNFDLRSPINITTTLTPPAGNYVPGSVRFTGPTSFDTAGRQDGNSTVQLIAVTTQAPIGSYGLAINATSPIAGGWNCTGGALNVVVDVDPFLKTTGGDVHSNKQISVPGGL